MMARFLRLVTLAVLLALASTAWAGTEQRLGTGGASEMRLPVGARSVGLGFSNAASVTGVEALFSNPAGLASLDKETEILFSTANWIADMKLNYVAVAHPMGSRGTVGLSAKVLSVGDIIRTTEASPDGTGETFTPTFTTLGVTYAKALTDHANFGGSVYYLSESILQTHSGGLAFDFGFQYETGYHGVRMGATMKNFGPSQLFGGSDFESNQHLPGDDPQAANRTIGLTSAEFELPSLFAGGASWPVLQGVNTLTLHGLFQSNSFGRDEARLGGEYTWRKDYSVRLGYKVSTNGDDLFGLSYGLGLRLPLGNSNLRVDYAGQQVSDFFDDVQHVGLTFSF